MALCVLAVACAIPTEAGSSGPPLPMGDTSAATSGPPPSTDSGSAVDTTAGSGNSSSSGDGTGVGFVMDADFLPGGSLCEVTSPSSCPPGEKCVVPYPNGKTSGTTCVPIDAKPVGAGEACSAFDYVEDMPVDDCDAGLQCLGVCRRLCGVDNVKLPGPDPSVCAREEACVGYGPFLDVCLAECDPLMQDCAELGAGCFLVEGAVDQNRTEPVAACAPVVADKSGGEAGGDCFNPNSCLPGNACVSSQSVPGCEGFACCSPMCDVTAPDGCDAQLSGTVCTPWFSIDPPAGLENVGACVLPS
ncbi:MAG: hypothetical protein K0V04_12450 [Deltaproteobacteria bacterium]|nr:hypothetical protein [Deltaproteobacteria bacterium]